MNELLWVWVGVTLAVCVRELWLGLTRPTPKQLIEKVEVSQKTKCHHRIDCASWHVTFDGKCLNCGSINTHQRESYD